MEQNKQQSCSPFDSKMSECTPQIPQLFQILSNDSSVELNTSECTSQKKLINKQPKSIGKKNQMKASEIKLLINQPVNDNNAQIQGKTQGKIQVQVQVLQNNERLSQFNRRLEVLNVQLQIQYLNESHNIIDQRNWRCKQQNNYFFLMSQNKEKFKQKYEKLIETHDSCFTEPNGQCCCYVCERERCENSINYCKCCICSCWGILMLSTCGCVGLPYYTCEFFEKMCDCYSFDCIKCCSCLYKHFGDPSDDTINRSEHFCFKSITFAEPFQKMEFYSNLSVLQRLIQLYREFRDIN